MSYIKAYSDENLRHSDLFKLKCPDSKVQEILDLLCTQFGVKKITLTWKGRGGGYYRAWGQVINLSKDNVSWLLVCHEFAHALTQKERSAATTALQAAIDRADQKRNAAQYGDPVYVAMKAQAAALRIKRDRITNKKAHSADFDANVDKACAFVRTQKLHEGAEPIPRNVQMLPDLPSGEASKAARSGNPGAPPAYDLVKTFFDRLPETLWCDKCNTLKSKLDIGVRVMSRSVDGRPTKVARQSYCKPCRSKK